MRFLRILGLARVVARLVGHDSRRRSGRRWRVRAALIASVGHVDAVGPHVGDQPVLVERLGDAHRVAGGEAKLARRFLLQGRGRERRRRVAANGLVSTERDGETAGLDHRLGGVGLALVADRQPVDLLAVELDQPRRERLAVGLEGRRRPTNIPAALKISISRSRSTIRRSATDCTRPADFAPGSLRHRIGDKVKPTR